MQNLPRLRLYDLFGCSVGYLFIMLCQLEVPCFASLSALSFPGIIQESIGCMFLRHSGCVACWLMLVCP